MLKEMNANNTYQLTSWDMVNPVHKVLEFYLKTLKDKEPKLKDLTIDNIGMYSDDFKELDRNMTIA